MLGLCLLGGCRQSAAPIPPPTIPSTLTLPPIGVTFVTQAAPTAVVRQTTATPLPPPSPTPSATPIVYTITAGDTLLAIAIQRGNSVEEIMALNPGIRPEMLQIGQEIILPPPATPLAQAAASTPVPIRLVVAQLQAYRSPTGGLWLLGELYNEGEKPVANARVELGLHAADGSLLQTAVTWAVATLIPTAERTPFGLLLPDAPPGFAYASVIRIDGESVTDLGTRYLGVQVQETVIVQRGERTEISGWVQNRGESLATAVRLILTLYDSQGQISGYVQQRLPQSLAPGERAPFTISTTPPGAEPTAVGLLINALREENDE